MASSRFLTASSRSTRVCGVWAGQDASRSVAALDDAVFSASKTPCCCWVGRIVCSMRCTGSCVKLSARELQSAAKLLAGAAPLALGPPERRRHVVEQARPSRRMYTLRWWMQWIQVLFLGCISALGAWIAYKQSRIAAAKLKGSVVNCALA